MAPDQPVLLMSVSKVAALITETSPEVKARSGRRLRRNESTLLACSTDWSSSFRILVLWPSSRQRRGISEPSMSANLIPSFRHSARASAISAFPSRLGVLFSNSSLGLWYDSGPGIKLIHRAIIHFRREWGNRLFRLLHPV